MATIFTRQFERRIYIAVGVAVFAVALGFSFGVYALWPARFERGYEPVQPLLYSHKLHGGEMQMECLYCHHHAETAAHANVPSVSVCMNCHELVQPKGEDGELQRDIAVLLKYWEQRQPIQWENVYNVADFVYFDHSRHAAAGLECQECHGPIETMERVRRVNATTMGWCLDCHRKPPPDGATPAVGSTLERPLWGPEQCYACHR